MRVAAIRGRGRSGRVDGGARRCCSRSSPPHSRRAAAGRGRAVAPVDYAAADLPTGAPVSLADYRGSPVLLSTWATWCEPCREEMPALERLYATRRVDGLVIVAVSINAAGPEERRIDALVREWGLTMPIWRDGDDRVTARFGGMGVSWRSGGRARTSPSSARRAPGAGRATRCGTRSSSEAAA